MSFNVKVISTLNDKNAHVFSMFCDLCVTWMVRFRLKSILVYTIFISLPVKMLFHTISFVSDITKFSNLVQPITIAQLSFVNSCHKQQEMV